MNKLIYILVPLFFIGLLLSELPVIIYKMYPQTSQIEYNLFLSNEYEEKITVLWYIYELAAILNRFIWVYAFCKVSILVSDKLFKIGVVFLCYHVSQFILYLWDRNSTAISNYIIFVCAGAIVWFLIRPTKNKSRYKSIE